MNAISEYQIDRRLNDTELAELANDFPKIPDEIKESLNMRFIGAQHWKFYAGFAVAALDVFNHLRHRDAEGFRLPRVQYVAALILKKAGHLFRHLELPYSPSILKKLHELPPAARSTIQNLLMDCPCEPHEYEKLEQMVAISHSDDIGKFVQLNRLPLFYAGLFHGYYKLHNFFAEDTDATDQDKADFAMSIAVFLAEKLVNHRNGSESESKTREAG